MTTVSSDITFLDRPNAESGPDRIQVLRRVMPYRGPYWECSRIDGPRSPQIEIWSDGDIVEAVARDGLA